MTTSHDREIGECRSTFTLTKHACCISDKKKSSDVSLLAQLHPTMTHPNLYYPHWALAPLGPDLVRNVRLFVSVSQDKKKKPVVPMMLVGNKSDKESDREVGTDELIALAEGTPGCGFAETSAKRNQVS